LLDLVKSASLYKGLSFSERFTHISRARNDQVKNIDRAAAWLDEYSFIEGTIRLQCDGDKQAHRICGGVKCTTLKGRCGYVA